ncbi:MAG: DUF1631 domain-containing protein [Dyella sp.]
MKDASENSNSNIVNLGARTGLRPQRGELLEAVRQIAASRLPPLLGGLFDNLDDALFDLAEKAESNAAQTHYFDGMRDVRKRRPQIERNFIAQVLRGIIEFAQARRLDATAAHAITSPQVGLELSLVADNELEESLAITGMVGKNESRLARDLFALNQRLSVIYGGLKVNDAASPLGPAALAQAFHQAIGDLSVDMRVKLIIYKLFDRYVMAALDDVYQEVNTALIRAGVLAQLRPELQRGPSALASDETHGVTSAVNGVAQPASAAPLTDEASADLLRTLASLLQARRAPEAGGASVPALPLNLPTANELIGALSVLQSQASAVRASQDISLEVQHLKEQLLAQIGALRGERPQQVAHIDEDAIDLVGMLFEFILEDRNLPLRMQALLVRLQIPYLKATILDRRLFNQRQHPARRLLDGLADAAKGWSEESDPDNRLHDTIKAIVDRLLREFDDDMGIFERLNAELQHFLDGNQRRAELAEQRVAESTRGREKLEQARHRAAKEILQRIGEQHLPPLVHGILTRAWANYLVLTLLRQGDDSHEFRDALRFINDFIFSTQPAPDAQARLALRQVLPNIERSLRRGLASVAFQEHDIERLLDQLHTYYCQQLGEAVPAAKAAQVADSVHLPIPDAIQSIVDLSPPAANQAGLDDLQAEALPELKLASELKPGHWLELVALDGSMERAKLSWISPISGRYLFVNRRGLKVADYSPHELADAFATGRAFVLESSALFDRALGAIVERLRHPATTSRHA